MPGHLRLPDAFGSRSVRDLRFAWSGDTCGQGWGINEAWGGMKIYEQIRRINPDFFLHSGDTIYADSPIPAEITLPDGSLWRNLVTEQTSKVAETLDEYRGRYRYNLMDANVRRLSAQVPQIWQWDDHEVTNNYSDSKDLSGDARYTEKNVPLLVARGTKAFQEYAPMRRFGDAESERIYRHLPQGPLLDVFVVDMRSYRGPNSANLQTEENAASAFLGRPQIGWLLDGLKRSKAVWKVIAADMPIGLHVNDGKDAEGRDKWEAIANGDDGAPRAASWRSRACSARSSATASTTSSGSRPTCITRPRISSTRPGRSTPTSCRSGSSSPVRCMPAASAPTRPTAPSACRWSTKRDRAWPTPRRRSTPSSSDRSTSTRRPAR